MIRELVASLPTPLAILLANYDEEADPDWPRLFKIGEWATIYIENVLRAETDQLAGMDRRSSWGMRCQTIRMLKRKLKDSGRSSILHLGQEKPASLVLDMWVELRNRWAHPHSVKAEPDLSVSGPDAVQMLIDLLTPICMADLLLLSIDRAARPCAFRLRGLQGLFDPPRIETDVPFAALAEPTVVLRREGSGLVRLDPFFRYRSGSHGENRVEFLVYLRDNEAEYIDPLPRIGARTGSARGPWKVGADVSL